MVLELRQITQLRKTSEALTILRVLYNVNTCDMGTLQCGSEVKQVPRFLEKTLMYTFLYLALQCDISLNSMPLNRLIALTFS